MVAAIPILVDPSEYLRREAEAATRHEFVAGIVCEMAGASRNHVVIQSNLATELGPLLKRGPCQLLGSDTKVWISPVLAYYYPDATVSCPPHFVDDAGGVIDNPTVVIEVLSPSTRTLDRGAKFADYRYLPSLKDYVLIDSEKRQVDVFSLEAGEWMGRSYTEGNVLLPSISVEIEMDELYRHVTFGGASAVVN